MIKLQVLVKKRKGMSVLDFQRYWLNVHGEKVKSSDCGKKYIRRYVQSHTLGSEYDGMKSPRFDGVAEIWFDSVFDKEAFFSDSEYLAKIHPDEMEFAELESCVFFMTEEKSVMP
jgi:uncharacterized protein (TIGR02118 family)